MKKVTLTIAIPAYNEEANIKKLLDNLSRQNYENIALDKILVVSDHSTDNTAKIVKAYKNKKVKLIENIRRIGKPAVQNIMFKNTNSDYLVILDADILPDGKNFIMDLINPLMKDKKTGMTGADTVPAKNSTFVEKVISDSHLFKTGIYKKMAGGNNIYMCHGRGRALSRSFYTKIKIPVNCSQEDAYIYLLCNKLGFKFIYTPKAQVIFRSPATIADHAKQSMRFSQGNKSLYNYFDGEFIQRSYELPISIIFKEVFKFIINNPVSAALYILIQVYIIVFKPASRTNVGAWNISASTKTLSNI